MRKIYLGAPSVDRVVGKVGRGDSRGLIVFSEPLDKLEVIKIFAFDEFIDFYGLADTEALESLLEDFEVMDIFVLEFSFPIDFAY